MCVSVREYLGEHKCESTNMAAKCRIFVTAI